MKKYIVDSRKYVIGILVGLIIGTSVPVLAATNVVQATFAKFNFVINGEATELSSDPLLYKGSTYLPVSVVSKLLGYSVNYEGATRTIKLNSQEPPTLTATSQTPQIDDIDSEKWKIQFYSQESWDNRHSTRAIIHYKTINIQVLEVAEEGKVTDLLGNKAVRPNVKEYPISATRLIYSLKDDLKKEFEIDVPLYKGKPYGDKDHIFSIGDISISYKDSRGAEEIYDITVKGESVKLEKPIIQVFHDFYMPLEVIHEYTDFVVEYDDARRLVTVDFKG